MKTLIIATAVLATSTTLALAHSTKPIDRTQARQDYAIEQGRYSGELTRREYRSLKREQAYIRHLEAGAKADGVVTGREYNEIRHAQRNASRHIYAEKHDNQKSLWRRWLYKSRH